MAKPEQAAREEIDRLLTQGGWVVCDPAGANITGHPGVAIREFQLKPGHGFADYMLYLDGKAAGVIEAKKAGSTLVGVQAQSAKYTMGLPDALPAWRRPLAFAYESTGVETRFTNGLDAAPRSRRVFAFHVPETLADWLAEARASGGIANQTQSNVSAGTFRVADGRRAHEGALQPEEPRPQEVRLAKPPQERRRRALRSLPPQARSARVSMR